MTMPCLLSNVKIECSGYTQDASQDAPAISCKNVLLEINNNRHLLVKIISIKKSPIGNHNFLFFLAHIEVGTPIAPPGFHMKILDLKL